MKGIHIDWDRNCVIIEDNVPLDYLAKFLSGTGENHGWKILICKEGEYENRGWENSSEIGR